MAYVLTPDDLAEKLRQQMGFLERSSKAFDDGYEEEAIRLAGTVRNLVHDTGSSHSVLGQLGEKENLIYVDTSERIDPRNLAPTMGLVEIRLEVGPGTRVVGKYAAPLGGDSSAPARRKPQDNRSRSKKGRRPRRPAAGDETQVAVMRGMALVQGETPGGPDPPPYRREQTFEEWWTSPITKDATGALFSRQDYVLAAANKEGGAHVDPTLEAAWAGLTRENSMGFMTTSGEVEVPLGNPALPTIRQIAYELDETVRQQLAHLL